jgi:hypothetical protein
MKEFTLKKLPSFSVVGIEGSSKDGPETVQKLWDKAENHIDDVLPSLRRDRFRFSPNLSGGFELEDDS